MFITVHEKITIELVDGKQKSKTHLLWYYGYGPDGKIYRWEKYAGQQMNWRNCIIVPWVGY